MKIEYALLAAVAVFFIAQTSRPAPAPLPLPPPPPPPSGFAAIFGGIGGAIDGIVEVIK